MGVVLPPAIIPGLSIKGLPANGIKPLPAQTVRNAVSIQFPAAYSSLKTVEHNIECICRFLDLNKYG